MHCSTPLFIWTLFVVHWRGWSNPCARSCPNPKNSQDGSTKPCRPSVVRRRWTLVDAPPGSWLLAPHEIALALLLCPVPNRPLPTKIRPELILIEIPQLVQANELHSFHKSGARGQER